MRAQPWLAVRIDDARSPAQLCGNLGALDIELHDDALERLNAVSGCGFGLTRGRLRAILGCCDRC